ncbi:lysophospholipid acyltransferase family protein [Sansalvadorimonas sp. 2012CJ34-2]|uniref:Lysophospholipid acyltransferase family protein n=1 Tax=Parendozoicomonas callyspongiae TaxID=2942213 RepID=A0ABT0PH53_9GAMM|nr:lysophospholipid acyltransferase family protein [Sansalvadorimonas sp. 2012CJ34-2]MCL6270705.1 lysophospholipid acyltransferase family protein [Sansalvadorimonas sp. 2012CJ34-2]
MRTTVFDTPVISHLLCGISWLLMNLTGWKLEGEKPKARKFVMIGAPHTSNWDFLVFMGVALRWRTPVFWLGKSSLFKGPMGPIMRWLGGIPVHRERKCNLVEQAVAGFNSHHRFVLTLSPEGTRSKVTKWKTGFWHIANNAKVPVYPGFVDFANKRCGSGPAYKLTGDIHQDIANLQAFYAPFRGRRQEEETPLVTTLTADPQQ